MALMLGRITQISIGEKVEKNHPNSHGEN